MPIASGLALQQRHNLLFQFILSELFTANNEIIRIKAISDATHSPANWKTIEPFIIPISRLAGPAQSYMRLFSWNDDGILNKLKIYASLLCQGGNVDEVEMHREANQAWILSVQALDFIYARGYHETFDLQLFQTILAKLQRSISRFTKLTLKVLAQFSSDENVIFFLLRHKEPLEIVYGAGFLSRFLRKIFGKSIKKAKEFLLERYAARGFGHLLPIINEKFAELSRP